MNAAANFAQDIYGENGKKFDRMLKIAVAEINMDAVRHDNPVLKFLLDSLAAKLDRLAFMVRLSARDGVPLRQGMTEKIRALLVGIDERLLENSLRETIDTETRQWIEESATMLAIGVCEAELINDPEIDLLSQEFANAEN